MRRFTFSSEQQQVLRALVKEEARLWADGSAYRLSSRWREVYPSTVAALARIGAIEPIPEEDFRPLRYGFIRESETETQAAFEALHAKKYIDAIEHCDRARRAIEASASPHWRITAAGKQLLATNSSPRLEIQEALQNGTH